MKPLNLAVYQVDSVAPREKLFQMFVFNIFDIFILI